MSVKNSASAKLFTIIAVLSLLVVSSVAVMATDQTASVPTWDTGQTWAVGGEMDLSNVLGENLGTLQDTLKLMNISLDNTQMTGSAGAWAVFKVLEVKQDTYLLEYSVGMKVHGNLHVYISGQLPREGTYDLRNMTTVSKSISGDGSLNLLITSHGVATVDKASMAIMGVVSTSYLDERMTFNATNFPNYTTSGFLPTKVHMTFEDYAVDESVHMELASTVDFTPALPLLKFPLTVGKNWSVDSKMTLQGEAQGYFNATGLPSMLASNITANGNSGVTSERIENLTSLGTLKLDNGTIGPVVQNVQTTMSCVGISSVDNGFGSNVTVFDVKEKQSGAHLLYSPDTEFLATALVKPQLDMLGGLITIPGGSITSSLKLNTEISMKSTSPTTATNAIAQVGASQGVEPVSLISDTGTGTSGPSQDSTILIVSVVAIVVIIAGVGGVLMMGKRGAKKP